MIRSAGMEEKTGKAALLVGEKNVILFYFVGAMFGGFLLRGLWISSVVLGITIAGHI